MSLPPVVSIRRSGLIPTMRAVYLDGRGVATIAETVDDRYDASLWPNRDLGIYPSLSDALGAIVRAVAAC